MPGDVILNDRGIEAPNLKSANQGGAAFGQPMDATGERPSLVPASPPSSHKSANAKSALELDFSDHNSPMLVDAELNFADPRLVAPFQWWMALRSDAAIPIWHNRYLQEDVAALRNYLHLYELDDEVEKVRLLFAGEDILRALGENPIDHWFTPAQAMSPKLRSSVARVLELAKLTQHTRAPLRTHTKAVFKMPAGDFVLESVWLPFGTDGASVKMMLAMTVFAPVAAMPSDAV